MMIPSDDFEEALVDGARTDGHNHHDQFVPGSQR
jgi:hypothetical protein